MGRWLGIDFGLARIGIAVSDERQIIVLPVTVMRTEKTVPLTVEKLFKEVSRYGTLEGIVIGLPLLLSGKEGDMAENIRFFGKHLESVFKVPVVYWDERLTSTQADRLLKDRGMRRKARAEVVDALAAMTILQSYLDSKH